MDPIPYAVIGTGGYASAHLSGALELQEEGLLQLNAVAEPFPERCQETINRLKAANVRHYEDWCEMLDREPDLQAISIPTPIPLHMPMAISCMKRKINVVLEKPPAVLIQDVEALIECAEHNDVICQVGFQNMLDPSARRLKRLILAGEIGDIRQVSVFGAWQRPDSYYDRAEWAGKIKQDDSWVLDGPLNNPLCHYVQQGLFFAGEMPLSTAKPHTVRAELYRAHPIEGEDIVCSRAELDYNTILFCCLTTCAPDNSPPKVSINGSRGSASWKPGSLIIDNENGRRTEQGARMSAGEVIRNFINALHKTERLLSPLKLSRNVILHNNACFKSSGRIHPLPATAINRYSNDKGEADTFTEVPGLVQHMERAAAECKLFSELGVKWAKQTKKVKCDFDHFNPECLCKS